MSRSYSVVVPAYNSVRTIETCLASVSAQTLPPLEVIVVDDSSRDGTAAAVRACEHRLMDTGIGLKFLRLEPNGGPSAARNLAMLNAAGTHIAFLDADDTWMSDKLAVVDSFAADATVGLICHSYSDMSNQRTGQPAKHTAVKWPICRMLARNPAQTSCAVVSRQYAIPFDESMRYCEDHDLWMRVAEHACVLNLVGPPLARLGRPQLSAGGLSGNVTRMRTGEMRVYYNFCRRAWMRRMWLLPLLIIFSVGKHVFSWIRRKTWR